MLPLLPESYFEKFDPKILLALRQTDKMTHRLAMQALFNQRNWLAGIYQTKLLSKAIHPGDIEIDTSLILACIKNPWFRMADRWHGMFIIAARNNLALSSEMKVIETRIKDDAIKERSIMLVNRLDSGWLKNYGESFSRMTEEKQIDFVFNTVLTEVNEEKDLVPNWLFSILGVIASRLTQEQIDILYDRALNKLNVGLEKGHWISFHILTKIAFRLTQEQIDIVYDKALSKLSVGLEKERCMSFRILTEIVFRLTPEQAALVFDKALNNGESFLDKIFVIPIVRASRLTQEQIDTVYDNVLNKLNDDSDRHDLWFDILLRISSRLSQEQMDTVYNKALNKLNINSIPVENLFLALIAIAPQLSRKQIDTVFDEAISKLYDKNLRLLEKVVIAIVSRLTPEQIIIVYDKALSKLNDTSGNVYCDSLLILAAIASRLNQAQIDTVFDKAFDKENNSFLWLVMEILLAIIPKLSDKRIIIAIEMVLPKLDARYNDVVRKAENLLSYVIVLGKWYCAELNKINVQHSPNRILIQHFAELFHQITSPNANKRKECSPKLDIGFFASQSKQKKITLENNVLQTSTFSPN